MTNANPANQTSLPESDLQRFKKQASCLGFAREPDYQYDPGKGAVHRDRAVSMTTLGRPPHTSVLFAAFCPEGEGVHLAV